jgi:hypothetical protein
MVADALSCCHEDGLHVHAISGSIFEAYDALREELSTHPQAMQFRSQLREGNAPPVWAEVDGILMFQGRAFLSDESSLWPMVLDHAHTMGHEGGEKTLHCVRAAFFSPQA